MNYFSLFALFLALYSTPAHAQYTEAPTETVELSMNQFHVTGHETVFLNGAPFSRITYQVKPELSSDSQLKSTLLLIGTFGGDLFAWHRFWMSDWDKERHFMAGYMIANVSNGLLQIILPQDTKHRRLISALVGFGMAALAGGAKEYYDSLHPQNHTADIKDFGASALGGAIGTITISFDLRKALYGRY